MIDLTDVTARPPHAGRARLGPLSASFAAGGAYALLGAPTTTVELVLALIAGSAAPKRGTVQVAGAPARLGPKVAYAPFVPDLPGVLDVGTFLAVAARVRSEPVTPAAERLAVLGVAALAGRRAASLSFAESRTVALVEALTSKAELLLLADPLADLDPRAVGHVTPAIAARREAGATVVVTTASREDALTLAREWLLFEEGKLVLRTADAEELAPLPDARDARLFVRSEGARYLLAELAADPTFETVHADGSELVVTGRDPVVMAAAVATAARRANAELDYMGFETGGRTR